MLPLCMQVKYNSKAQGKKFMWECSCIQQTICGVFFLINNTGVKLWEGLSADYVVL